MCEKINYPKVSFESIFLNLLTNAIKYRSPKRAPQIIFKSYIDEDGMITLTCQDNGIGIDLDKHEQNFGLNKTFHDPSEGTGFSPKQGITMLKVKIKEQNILSMSIIFKKNVLIL
jgi:light-regulated signal transduction histidine kinase (bacteriophytochrome)